MAWGVTDHTLITYSAVNYYFAPNELVYVGNPDLARNQIRQESESGEVTVQELDSNTREVYSFAINKMPSTDRTVGGLTIRGFDSLKTLISSTINYGANTVSLKPATVTIGGIFTARYWSNEFPGVPLVRIGSGGLEYYGDGSSLLVFRKEI